MSEVIDLLRASGVECYTRAEWGSPRERDGSYARRVHTHPIRTKARYHYLHISVTRDTDTVAEGAAGARQIEGFGYTTPPMVSYQLLTTNEGKVYEGQNYGVKGTHTINDKKVPGFPRDLNYYGYAVALMQNVGDAVTDVQVDVIARCFAAAELAGYVEVGAPIYPHRKFAWKACPGDKAVDRLEDIAALKDHYVKEGLADMASPDEVWNHVLNEYDPNSKRNDAPARILLAQAHKRASDARREAIATRKAVEAIADALEQIVPGVQEAVSAAVDAGLQEALEEGMIEVNVNVKGKDNA